MEKLQGHNTKQIRVGRRAKLAPLVLLAALLATVFAPPAWANLGYEPDAVKPSRPLPEVVRGVTVDQSSQDIYVAVVSTNLFGKKLGAIDRFNSDLSVDQIFAEENGYYAGVAIDSTHGFYAAQAEIRSPFGNFGTTKVEKFTSLGVPTGSFALSYPAALPPIAIDSAGNIFYPSISAHSVQVFDPTGVLLETITCGGCPGGSFGEPASVALSSADELYVADANPDRVVKLVKSGGSYVFASMVQSGRGAGAVAVDPATGSVLVGDMPEGKDFHIVAYDSSGTQFDDFGAGLFTDATIVFSPLAAYQMAVNDTTHKLYVAENEKLHVFEKVTIAQPTALIKSATGVGQLTATLNATVNAKGHATLECEFEYTNEADFLANGFTNAIELPCPENPDGSGNRALEVEVPGLTPDTDYRYRVTAASNAGSISSGTEAFKTLPEVAPTVTMESPIAITQTTATIRARVNPHGGSVSSCHFDFGTSSSYGTVLPCATTPGPVATDIAESKDLSGLQQGAAYHYRLVLSTNAGTAQGSDVEFNTMSPPSEPGVKEEKAAPAGPIVAPPPRDCRKGFRRRTVHGRSMCVKVCPKGSRAKRLGGKVRCVRLGGSRSHRRRHAGP